MNQRIYELYEQALKFAYETAGVDTENGTILASLTAGRFAELIVQECMDYASRNWEHGHLLAQDLKTHFGVEE